MQEKKCTACGKVKRLSSFAGPWNDRGRQRWDARCRPCRKRYNAAYYRKWSGKEKTPPKHKVCISCKEERTAKHFAVHKGRPDGLQSDCHQCRGEKQRLAIFRKQHSRNFQLPAEKTCKRCGKTKPHTEFYRASAKNDGLASACKKCLYASKNAARRKINVTEPTVTEKWCPGCLDVLPAASFSRSSRYRTGLWTYCKACDSERARMYRKNYNVTDPMEGFKMCPRCESLLPTSEFWKNRYEKSGIGRYCGECYRIIQSERRARKK